MKRDGAHYLLSAEAGFSAAHTLPGVDMCERFHGHNWRVRLTVRVYENRLDQLGIILDPAKNAAARGIEARIDAQGSRTQIWVVPTNEELVVARETYRLLIHNRSSAAREPLPELNSQLSTLNSQLNHG